MRKFWCLILFVLVASIIPLSAQESEKEEEKEEKSDFRFDWKDVWEPDNAIEMHVPTIEINSGVSMPSLHEDVFSGNFSDVNNIGIKLGFSDYLENEHSESIFEYKYSFFMLNHYLSGITTDEASHPDLEVNAWQFGFGSRDGYGYKLGDYANVVLYHAGGLTWTKLDFQDTAIIAAEQGELNRFGDAFRFGERFEGGVGIRFSKNIGINAGYERSIVFQRHLFWKWLYSEVVAGLAQGGMSLMINAIEKSSPNLVPVVNFILRNAMSYGIYELRSKDMNWPAETAPPFMFDSFKLGVTFTF